MYKFLQIQPCIDVQMHDVHAAHNQIFNRVATVMERSLNFWNFKTFWNF